MYMYKYTALLRFYFHGWAGPKDMAHALLVRSYTGVGLKKNWRYEEISNLVHSALKNALRMVTSHYIPPKSDCISTGPRRGSHLRARTLGCIMRIPPGFAMCGRCARTRRALGPLKCTAPEACTGSHLIGCWLLWRWLGSPALRVHRRRGSGLHQRWRQRVPG